MSEEAWRQVLGIYCERGFDPSFWGEPLNAVTNVAFLIAGFALIGTALRDERVVSAALAVLIIVIGVGSFLFHTLATPWAGAADVIPILIFMLTAVYALARRATEGPVAIGLLAVAGFYGLLYASRTLGRDLLPGFGAGLGYAPAMLVLIGGGLALTALRRPGGPMLLFAGVVFAASLTLRTLDQPLCDVFTIGDVRIGSHFMWHLLNAVTLYLTARALIGMGRGSGSPRPAGAAG